MGKQKSKKHLSDVSSDITVSVCSLCEAEAVASTLINCKGCCHAYHPVCAGMSDDVFQALAPVLPNLNWVCTECIGLITDRRKSLQSNVEVLEANMTSLQKQLVDLSSKVESLSTTVEQVSHVPSSRASLAVSVSSVVTDELRRKRNVIVSGLPEYGDVSKDCDELRAFCEEYVGIKPWFDESKCRRIGKNSPRKLLISLHSDQSASELLQLAKRNLSKLDVASAAAKVYFNPDLSPAEAERAFHKRQERRQRALRSNGVSDAAGNVLNPLATTFQPTS